MVLTIKLSMKYMKYKVVADHLTENKSKDDKAHLLVLITRQKRRQVNTDSVRIDTPTTSIRPTWRSSPPGHEGGGALTR